MELQKKKKKTQENNSVLPAGISHPNLRETLPVLAAVMTLKITKILTAQQQQ